LLFNDESICASIHNQPIKENENISLEDNKYLARLSPIESSSSPSSVPNSKEKHGEGSKCKIRETILINIGTPIDPNILQVGAQCTKESKRKSN